MKALKRSLLLEDFDRMPLDFYPESEDAIRSIEEVDFDDPYLDVSTCICGSQ